MRKLDIKDIKFPVKIRDIDKIKRKLLSAFLVMKLEENVQSAFQKIL